jgi:cobalt/nickel transport system permease protein
LHHVVLETWTRRRSVLHARDARAKLLVLAGFLIALGTTRAMTGLAAACYGAFVLAGILLARLPAAELLLRATVVLPFTAAFALFALIEGQGGRAAAFLEKSYLSAAAVLVVAGSTRLPALLRGMESLGAPRLIAVIIQFVYRYLFVISEQAQHMRLAAASRGRARRLPEFRSAAGAVSVLFARSYGRAEGIHSAMLARGFTGSLPALESSRFRVPDALLAAGGLALALAIRLWNR